MHIVLLYCVTTEPHQPLRLSYAIRSLSEHFSTVHEVEEWARFWPQLRLNRHSSGLTSLSVGQDHPPSNQVSAIQLVRS